MKAYYFPAHLYLKNFRKKNHNPGPYLGEAFEVPRKGEKGVRVRLYRPVQSPEKKSGGLLPVLFNVHGGAWMHGDAEGLDLQSQYLANHLKCFVVNVDYKLIDEKPFPYQQTEIADVVEYFIEHAGEYGVDPERSSLFGYSAGGHIAAGAAMLARDRGVKLCSQVLCYPFLNFIGFDFAAYGGVKGVKAKIFNRFSNSVLFEKMKKDEPLMSPANADPEELKDLARAVIVSCGKNDPLLPQAEQYSRKLEEAGVKNVYREYKTAEHGFLERNFKDDPAVFAKEGEQDALMREAVEFIRSNNVFEFVE